MTIVRTVILSLSLYPGIGAVTIARLLREQRIERLGELVTLSSAEIAVRYGLSARVAEMVYAALRTTDAVANHDEWCERNGVSVVFLTDPEYPALLKHINTPPAVLWVKGCLPSAEKKHCALVGSRDANHYGNRVVSLLVQSLVANNIVTVSGGARGIDGWVHEQTIAAGGVTIAVMGCGLSHTYPIEHRDLFERIVASGGALVSPFAPLVEPTKGSFPARNRIIAGLSGVCVVVQAAVKSGALITAEYALEENREVAAVPGPIDDVLSAGCNQLLAQGAHVIVDGASLLRICGVGDNALQVRSSVYDIENVEASVVLSLLDVPATIDDLLEIYSGTPAELQEQLFALQIAGKVKKNHVGMWVRCG